MSSGRNDSMKYAAIEFNVKNQLLIATSIRNRTKEPQEINQISDILEATIQGSHELETKVLKSLAQLSRNNESEVIEIEPHIDGQFDVIIDEQMTTATFSYNPAFYGKEVDYDEIIAELDRLGLNANQVDTERIKQCIVDSEACSVIVARGRAAIDGTDASIDIIFNTDTIHGPETRDDGTVDHYNTHDYVTVNENTPLLKRTPPTTGTSGISIFGDTIEPIPGKDIQFVLNDTVKLDDDDSNILISRKSGHPIIKDNTVLVDDTLILSEASLETGNIEYSGSVKISGDVKPNVRVEASGDIHVDGTVENADLISGNTVHVLKGVICTNAMENQEHQGDNYTTFIKAQNDIYIKYCNFVKAEAGNCIYVQDYSLHSTLQAGKAIISGYNNGKGKLIGGEVIANQHIKANVVGSEAYVRTTIECIGVAKVKEQISKLEQLKAITVNEREMLIIVLNEIKSQGTPSTVGNIKLEKAKKVYHQIKTLTLDIDKISHELNRLKDTIDEQNDNIIEVNKALYSNVQIIISEAKTITSTDRKICKIKNIDNEIRFT